MYNTMGGPSYKLQPINHNTYPILGWGVGEGGYECVGARSVWQLSICPVIAVSIKLP